MKHTPINELKALGLLLASKVQKDQTIRIKRYYPHKVWSVHVLPKQSEQGHVCKDSLCHIYGRGLTLAIAAMHVVSKINWHK